MLYGIGIFSQKEALFERINRARICIRICVRCVFYKLSIGGFRMSAHFFFLLLSLRLTSVKMKEKSWPGGLEAQRAKRPCQILRASLL